MPKAKKSFLSRLSINLTVIIMKLEYERPDAWGMLNNKDVFSFADEYKKFIGNAKTEREVVSEIIRLAEKSGFKPWPKSKERFYISFKEKAIALVVKGMERPENGLFVLAAHLDSPRIDLKMVPLYEDKDSNLALLDTHYYGGIKKYQWLNHPLAMHGVIVKKNGKKINVKLGEKGDEVLVIPDLLPHLAKKQLEKPAKEFIEGENLDLVAGHIPKKYKEKGKEEASIKKAILDILNKKYGIEEADLISADLEVVPAGQPRDVGFDRGLIGGYGHDDRSSVFTVLKAVLGTKRPARTVVAFFFDKEEIGSEGNTSAKSHFLRHVVSLIAKDPDLALLNSVAISADVDAGIHPLYKDVFEKKNAGVLGRGVIITKYTGYGGKYMASEARAEFVASIRRILDSAKVPWQPGTLGKVDAGGGGTVAAYLARYGMDIIDMGVPVLSMHSPFEIISKADLYSAYLAFKAFIGSKL